MKAAASIRTTFARVDPALVRAYAQIPSCDVADALGTAYTLGPSIRHIAGGTRLAGCALTVRTRPDDNLMIQAAVDVAQPGDVIVVAGGGDATALVGEMVTLWAKRRGVAGFVVDGMVRDVDLLVLPTFARGVTPRAPFKVAAGEVGYPVGIAGQAIAPGDLIVADRDGVAVVPRALAVDALGRAQAVAARDREARRAIAEGVYDRSWLNAALNRAGVETEEGDRD